MLYIIIIYNPYQVTSSIFTISFSTLQGKSNNQGCPLTLVIQLTGQGQGYSLGDGVDVVWPGILHISFFCSTHP